MDFSAALKNFGQNGPLQHYGIEILNKNLPIYQQNIASKTDYTQWVQDSTIQHGSDQWQLRVWPTKASLDESHI